MATSNENRAQRAEKVLQFYVGDKGEVFERSTDEVCDLIADLLHLTKRLHAENNRNRDVEQMLAMAQMHFDAELNDPEEEEGAAS